MSIRPWCQGITGSPQLRLAFTAEVTRTQRRSDGSFSLEGIRFEVPSRYAHFHKLTVRHASWDRSFVHLADPVTGVILCRLYPQDKNKNAEGRRAPRQPMLPASPPAPPGMKLRWGNISRELHFRVGMEKVPKRSSDRVNTFAILQFAEFGLCRDGTMPGQPPRQNETKTRQGKCHSGGSSVFAKPFPGC